ncbi:MAG: LysR family transcriptional regulator [Lachnospiraceae bacterium]|nr:LysR family transcriptional regulator [Lachnospiraceae bacterium]
MNQRFEAFLAVAECKSMQKAAEQQCVSYQCISGHIRSLEEEYHTKLFERRPNFALTESGRILAESLQKIRLIEQGISEALDDAGEAVVGTVKLGVPFSRYSEIVPPILARFKREYPNVELEINGEFSDVLEQQVERGLLDMALVVQQAGGSEKLERKTLLKEHYSFLVSRPLLAEIMGENRGAAAARWQQNGIRLREISRFPLVSAPAGSRLRAILDAAAKKQSLTFRIVFSSNRLETFDAIARTDLAGCLLPQQMTRLSRRLDWNRKAEERLLILPVDWEGAPIDSDVALIRHRESVFPAYKRRLMQILEEQFQEMQ